MLKIKTNESMLSKHSENQHIRHFLNSGNKSLSKQILLENRPRKKLRRRILKQHVLDSRTLTATELKAKYPLTYHSWRNMKSRGKSCGAIIDEKFNLFADFLRLQGPRKDASLTLDRLDNDNPAYGPGLCEWRDKKQQANNRSTTIKLTHDGQTLPLTQWAERTNQSADTLRRRRKNGWKDLEIVTGKRITFRPESDDCFPKIWPGDLENRKKFEREFESSGYRGTLSRSQYAVKRTLLELDWLKHQLAIDLNGVDPYGDPYQNLDDMIEVQNQIKYNFDNTLAYLRKCQKLVEREDAMRKNREAEYNAKNVPMRFF